MSIPEMERGAPKAATKARNKPVKELHRTATVDLESKHKAIAAAKLKLEKNERLAAAASRPAASAGIDLFIGQTESQQTEPRAG